MVAELQKHIVLDKTKIFRSWPKGVFLDVFFFLCWKVGLWYVETNDQRCFNVPRHPSQPTPCRCRDSFDGSSNGVISYIFHVKINNLVTVDG